MATIHEKMTAIGDAIREKTGGTELLTLDDMAVQIGGISTGVELNFDVVGGTTQPSSASENTIWVNTDQEITTWIFSATEPTNLTEGMVWIFIGTSSSAEFNALKKDGIQIYPMSANQYVSGTWINKEAKSYQGGKWVAWLKKFAFDLNTTNWTTVSGKSYSHSFKNGDDGSLIFSAGPQNEVATYYSAKYYEEPVDLTDYDKLTVDIVWQRKGGNVWYNIYLATSPTGSAVAKLESYDSTSGEKSLDVSNLNGEYYLVLLIQLGYAGNGSLQINSIELTEVI